EPQVAPVADLLTVRDRFAQSRPRLREPTSARMDASSHRQRGAEPAVDGARAAERDALFERRQRDAGLALALRPSEREQRERETGRVPDLARQAEPDRCLVA